MLSRCRRALARSAASAKQLLSTVALGCPSSKGNSSWAPPAGHPTGIRVYNSLTRSKEPLLLTRPGVVTWYSCGPTVYDHAHLGHACSYVRFDIIRRILSKVFEKDVVMAMVITDIDDKIIKRANELNISPDSLARTYEQDFKDDMAALQPDAESPYVNTQIRKMSVLHPTVYIRVTDNIAQIISFIERIIKNGHGYATEKGNVYFDIQSIGDKYGKFSGFPSTEDEISQSDKRHTRDFALWKTSKPQEPFWCSPWGKGRPGWHIECSTIASAVFGSQLDIHSGGIDLAFPHHENEIAQCEAYHQCEQWGNYFLHTGHLHTKGNEEKMSKSLKNYITIKQFLQSFSADQFRMFCLRCKYRSAVDFSVDSMRDAKSTLKTISSFIHDATAYMKGQLICPAIAEDILWERLASTKESVRAAFADDFDTATAVDLIMDLIHHGNKQLKAVSKETVGSTQSPVVYGTIVSYITQFFSTLGISVATKQIIAEDKSSSTLYKVMDELIDFRSKVRNYALATSQGPSCEHTEVPEEERLLWKEKRKQLLREREPLIDACDTMRQDLAAFGINLKDRGDKTTWEYLETDEKM